LELKTGGMAGVSDDTRRFLLPDRETGYTYANPRSQPTEDQRNGMKALIGGVRGKEKASKALGKSSSALFNYQKNHEPGLINKKMSAASQQVKAKMGPERRSAATEQGNETKGPEERSAAAQQAKATLGEEGLSAAHLRRRAKMGQAGLSAAALRGNETKRRRATLGQAGLSAASQKARKTQFFGKDDGLTTEAPENPGSFFPQGTQRPVIDLTQNTPAPTETTNSDRDNNEEPGIDDTATSAPPPPEAGPSMKRPAPSTDTSDESSNNEPASKRPKQS
jgi:hypothetical protein